MEVNHILLKYFPNLSKQQQAQFDNLFEVYVFWNAQINVISRKDIDLLYERHILHSLAIAKVCTFNPQAQVLDVGTGGGFPGIPLAILFPETHFTLVDAIGKKIKVVSHVAEALSLKNVTALHSRADKINKKFDFVVSRAVTSLKEFYPWIHNKFTPQKKDNKFKNGVLYLKGGDLSDEITQSGLKNIQLFPIKNFFDEDFFETKYVLYFPAKQ
ncbi:MAG: 16S rRNA (guanine(527)-N(7))-methyltransferase RsmG [Sphingobacteriales bacterium]|nr:MAG: 16S rRNA (guanine(527)-N(7))-methyltransferase RsmG [Sphingobacteriales bacterium]TAF83182.1 MAG: 16S rRNA (guanine(527)-N(7))-methyltransferase RsmG [Sphingobacteriales bacterium]